MDIVLIPGLWLDGSSWDEVIPSLQQAGHRTHALHCPEWSRRTRTAPRSLCAITSTRLSPCSTHSTPPTGRSYSVGHSGGGAIAHAAVDARPDRVARVVYVDSAPVGEGGVINAELPAENGEMPLPDWSRFEEQDLIDLDDELRTRFRERAIPAPGHVASDPQQLFDERRYDVPITVITCEFPSAVFES